jgi:hypothetical protein
MKTLHSLQKDGSGLTFCGISATSEAVLPTSAKTNSIYSTLPLDHIRLLRLYSAVEPRKATDDIASLGCDLAVFPIELMPPYVALSYCWGATGTTYPLVCSGQEFRIQQNLHNVLMHLQEVEFQDWLWIDSICIMQNNNEEKNQQIPLMKHIFQKADVVLAWVGEAPEALVGAWEFMKRLPFVLKELRGTCGPVTLDWHTKSAPPTDLWHTVADFFGRSFFTRLWILQEVILARKLYILYGEFLFDWSELVPIFEVLAYERNLGSRGWGEFNLLTELQENCGTIKLIETARENQLYYGHIPDVCYIIFLSQRQQVTDLRDKVYGMLSLLNERIRTQIHIDVGKSVVNVYTDFSKCLVTAVPDAEFLRSAGISKSGLKDLPSWCVDLSTPAGDELNALQFKAGLDLFPRSPHLSLHATDPVIEFTGWEVDHVAEVVEHPKNETSPQFRPWGFMRYPMAEATWKWDEKCLGISKAVFNEPESIPEAHWRTITAERSERKDGLAEYLEWKNIIFENWQHVITDRNWSYADKSVLTSFGNDVGGVCSTRKFFSTVVGRVGVGPMAMQTGDSICIPFGSRVPYVMHRNGTNGRYKLLGEVYCYGLMQGEIFGTRYKLTTIQVRFAVE